MGAQQDIFKRPGKRRIVLKSGAYDCEVGHDSQTGLYWGMAWNEAGEVVAFTDVYTDCEDAWAELIGQLGALR